MPAGIIRLPRKRSNSAAPCRAAPAKRHSRSVSDWCRPSRRPELFSPLPQHLVRSRATDRERTVLTAARSYQALAVSGLKVEDVFQRVRNSVAEATHAAQIPGTTPQCWMIFIFAFQP